MAKGAKCDTLKERSRGMWSYGSGPSAAKLVKFKAVKTEREILNLGFSVREKQRTVQHNNFMRGIDVEALSERECRGIIVEGGIGGRVVDSNWCVRQTSDHLLNVADTLYSSNWRTKGGVIPEE